ncbi:FtsB family cell division protein [Avrilella dinanensis]|uniref:Septum formation initiator n=1 Tax=Avrilella dinanensis TaxID=2008672 RepID=A0A2M9R4J3_9FLAO|nr:septum formation initiator family protein [Avrilella dinanensis]PJR03791.1 septum formation initiator [Avrilella dinanensis]
MKEKFARLIQKYPFVKWFTNRFVLVTIFFAVWLIFFDTYSFFDHREINQEINKLEKNKEFYQSEIEKDKKSITKLNQKEELEKFAREQYYMKRENEDVFIIEIDSAKTK